MNGLNSEHIEKEKKAAGYIFSYFLMERFLLPQLGI
jgi:hypothetical protein